MYVLDYRHLYQPTKSWEFSTPKGETLPESLKSTELAEIFHMSFLDRSASKLCQKMAYNIGKVPISKSRIRNFRHQKIKG